jgi:hypothetical protein
MTRVSLGDVQKCAACLLYRFNNQKIIKTKFKIIGWDNR